MNVNSLLQVLFCIHIIHNVAHTPQQVKTSGYKFSRLFEKVREIETGGGRPLTYVVVVLVFIFVSSHVRFVYLILHMFLCQIFMTSVAKSYLVVERQQYNCIYSRKHVLSSDGHCFCVPSSTCFKTK